MALRVLSGLIHNNTGLLDGFVIIGFNPHRLIFGDARITKMRTIGSDGEFTDVPTEHIGLRELSLAVPPPVIPFLFPGSDIFVNTQTTQHELVVRWKCYVGLAPEISYMVIGDV